MLTSLVIYLLLPLSLMCAFVLCLCVCVRACLRVLGVWSLVMAFLRVRALRGVSGVSNLNICLSLHLAYHLSFSVFGSRMEAVLICTARYNDATTSVPSHDKLVRGR